MEYWDRTFTGPLTVAGVKDFIADTQPAQEVVPHHEHRMSLGGARGRHQRSQNWSGGFVTPAAGGQFVQVRGLWNVPTPKSRPDGAIGAEYRSSVWIGLDGQRRYFHSSLPQIGTAQFVTKLAGGDDTKLFCWWQWWHRNKATRDHRIALDVEAGHLISADVTVLDRTWVKFFIINVTRQQMYPVFKVPAPLSTYADVDGKIQVMVSGATAEWITERPRMYVDDDETNSRQISLGMASNGDDDELDIGDRGDLYSLPDYGVATFSACHAIARSAPDAPGYRVHDLKGAKFITMYETLQEPARTVDISIGRWVSNACLMTTYRAP